MYQAQAWCDQEIMKEWFSTEWANPFKSPIGQNSDVKILIADVYFAQQTDSVKELSKKHKTFLVNVLQGNTSRVQVVDALISKSFNDEVHSLFEDHVDKNLNQYVDGKINASQRRVVMKKWDGEALPKVGKTEDSIIRSFKKCGLSVALDGSENDEVNIDSLPEYQMPSAFVQDNEYVLDDDDESEKEDEDKGKSQNEEEFKILIHSDLPIVTESYSFKKRIKQPRRKTFSF